MAITKQYTQETRKSKAFSLDSGIARQEISLLRGSFDKERTCAMKLAELAQKTADLLPLLRCPLCGQAFSLRGEQSLVCESGHCFDLSRKGYVNLAPSHDQLADKYGAALFDSRRRILDAGFYAPLAEAVRQLIDSHLPRSRDPFTLLDAGCGEGYYARFLARAFPSARVLGVDLSRDAVIAAAKGETAQAPHWLVGNLSRLPLADHSIDALINVLTPADYREFARALSPEGFLIKVVPGQRYLFQIRKAAAPLLQSDEYSNAQVLRHLEAHTQVLERRHLCDTLPVTPEQAADFVRMTPMTFGLSPDALQSIAFEEITIELEVVCCRMAP